MKNLKLLHTTKPLTNGDHSLRTKKVYQDDKGRRQGVLKSYHTDSGRLTLFACYKDDLVYGFCMRATTFFDKKTDKYREEWISIP